MWHRIEQLPIALLLSKKKRRRSERVRKGREDGNRGTSWAEQGTERKREKKYECHGGTRVASAERCVRYLRGSQPAGIVIVWKYVYTRGLKYTVGIRPNDDRSPSFFHLLSPRKNVTVPLLWSRKRERERDREASSRSCFNSVPICPWRNVCVLPFPILVIRVPPSREKEIFLLLFDCTSSKIDNEHQ